MNPRAQAERNHILAEIDTIVRELYSVASEVETQRGIGTEHCGVSLRSVAQKYQRLRNKLAALH